MPVFKALHGQAPQCLTDDCQLVAAAGRQLRLSDAVTCLVLDIATLTVLADNLLTYSFVLLRMLT